MSQLGNSELEKSLKREMKAIKEMVNNGKFNIHKTIYLLQQIQEFQNLDYIINKLPPTTVGVMPKLDQSKVQF